MRHTSAFLALATLAASLTLLTAQGVPPAKPPAAESAAAGRSDTTSPTGQTANNNLAMEILKAAVVAERAPKPAAERADSGAVVSVGPWGTLQSLEVYIAAPDHILEYFRVPSALTAWNFLGMAEDQVLSLLTRPDIPESARRELGDRSRWNVMSGRIQVTPSNVTNLSIPPAARAAIYQALEKWDANEFQKAPYFVPGGDVDTWLGKAGLRGELVEAIRKTIYPCGRTHCFSDVSLLVSLTESHAEARQVLKALSRTRTALLRLRLEDSDDLVKIARYWSGGKANAKDFLPLLESIATNPAVEHLDLIHVLPPYARKLMYTYPHQSLAIGGRYPDCHWTSLNFFNYTPEGRFFDITGATMFTVENYTPGEPPYTYGDVLFFTDHGGNAIHSCVYLADDFVFTKNGANLISPWIIMKLQEVVDRYSVLGDPTIRIYRKAR